MRTLISSHSAVHVFVTAFTALTLVCVGIATILAQERDRARIPDRYKWNLADIYANDSAWRTAKDKVASGIPALGQYKGRLLSSARTLADALESMSALDKELSRLYVYAGLIADEDTRDSGHEGM